MNWKGWVNYWQLTLRFPKFMLVAVVLIISTGLFAIWWYDRSPKHRALEANQQAETVRKVGQIAATWDQLILADNDLYDVTSGELLFRNWLERGMPVRLFWEAPTKTVLAQYELGFVRYGLDGKEMASMLRQFPFALTDDDKGILYAKDRDVWRAEVDWPALKPINERRVTSIEQFSDAFFAKDIVLGTEKTLVIHQAMKLLRVNLETGDVNPMTLPNINLARQRSPDSKTIAGIKNGQLFCYDVDSDSAKTAPVGRVSMSDFQWLNNDRAACILNQKLVALYDRTNNALTEICQLPFPCFKIGEASPTGRYFFCANNKQGVLVDLEMKKAAPITGGAGAIWISVDTFAFSREVPDSGLRGTWLQTVGENERRVSPEPYLVVKSGPMLLGLKGSAFVVFAAVHGIFTMKTDGAEVTEAIRLPYPPFAAVGLETRIIE